MTTRHFFNQTQPLPLPVREEGMAERWLNRKNPRRCWNEQSFGAYAAEALPDWSEPVVIGGTLERGEDGGYGWAPLSLYTEETEATTNVYVTAPFELTRSPYRTIERNPDHLLKQRHSGTWIVERTR